MSQRILVAGIGNIFLSDDGFGVEVAQRLKRVPLPCGVKVMDAGIRGIHLAYELSDGYDIAILIDAMPRCGVPGTLYVIEPGRDDIPEAAPEGGATIADAHGLEPLAMLALARQLGKSVNRLLVVGCEPATVEEGLGLSPAVAAAVDEAVALVASLVASKQPGDDSKSQRGPGHDARVARNEDPSEAGSEREITAPNSHQRRPANPDFAGAWASDALPVSEGPAFDRSGSRPATWPAARAYVTAGNVKESGS